MILQLSGHREWAIQCSFPGINMGSGRKRAPSDVVEHLPYLYLGHLCSMWKILKIRPKQNKTELRGGVTAVPDVLMIFPLSVSLYLARYAWSQAYLFSLYISFIFYFSPNLVLNWVFVTCSKMVLTYSDVKDVAPNSLASLNKTIIAVPIMKLSKYFEYIYFFSTLSA